ncbi:glycosyltransferase [Planococcus shixiaomingii]|uniref:glycosyltransferase n=1 Tax=Planococcus shixiaomingii TaxID=3058393 RepID=UPI00260509D0|nr:glycosyltransferase [Planococcus sp. N022]WKA53963.1 glycosyltransferase [Planococcus sp. N022]
MKVMHIGENTKGGVGTYLNHLLPYQSKSSDIEEVFLVTSEKTEFQDGDNVYKYAYERNIIGILKAGIIIYKKIEQLQPEIIHIHSTFAGFYTRGLLLFKKRSFKVVYCAHGWSFLMETSRLKQNIYVLIESILALATDKIINISNYEHQQALQYSLLRSKSVLIYNGISENRKTVDINLRVDPTKINLLFIGRFDKQKGLDILIKTFSDHNLSNITVYLIGEQVVERKEKEISFPSNFVQLGWLDNEIIDSYYSLFDAVIVPSRWEGFGLVAIEAMKNKKAVIASNKGALPEIVIHGKTGYLFDIENENSILKVLFNLNKKELIKLGEKGEERFLEKFTSDLMNKKIIEIYKSIVKEI